MRILLTLALMLPCLAQAQAHAFLDHASPRVGSTGPAPAQVELWMTEDLEPAFTKIKVFDAQSHQVDKMDAKISGATIIVSLPKLAPGTYLVKWSAVATDTHHTTGTFKFTVQ
jgi:methionine-rich copper-binding protein CopC